jgi:hypothetical protein
MSDLIMLVPDKNIEAAVRGLLSRHQSLGIRQVDHKIYPHPARDPGCFGQGHEFLRSFTRLFSHALILFDRDGCGREDCSREELETLVEDRLRSSGWGDRARAVVIDPELEVWVWSDSPHVPSALGCKDDIPTIRRLLIDQGLWTEGQAKPADPKGAMEVILRMNGRPRSSAIYENLARKVSLQRCQDGAFLKLRDTLVAWFAS